MKKIKYTKYMEEYQKIQDKRNKLENILCPLVIFGLGLLVPTPVVILADKGSHVVTIIYVTVVFLLCLFAVIFGRMFKKSRVIDDEDYIKIVNTLHELKKYQDFLIKKGKLNYIFYVIENEEIKKIKLNKTNFDKINAAIFKGNTVTFKSKKNKSYIDLDNFENPVICSLKCKNKKEFLSDGLSKNSRDKKENIVIDSFAKIK